MPWSGTSLMDQRAQFGAEAASGLFSMTELCQRYGISRKTGYKWEERYDGEADPRVGMPPARPGRTRTLRLRS